METTANGDWDVMLDGGAIFYRRIRDCLSEEVTFERRIDWKQNEACAYLVESFRGCTKNKFQSPELEMCLTCSKNSKVYMAEARPCRVLQARVGTLDFSLE